jgi:transcriptional regulator with XRE-family HTH domain
VRLGQVLRRYRLMEETDLRTLAKQIGIGAATLMRLEQGRDPSGETLAKVLNWLTKS